MEIKSFQWGARMLSPHQQHHFIPSVELLRASLRICEPLGKTAPGNEAGGLKAQTCSLHKLPWFINSKGQGEEHRRAGIYMLVHFGVN